MLPSLVRRGRPSPAIHLRNGVEQHQQFVSAFLQNPAHFKIRAAEHSFMRAQKMSVQPDPATVGHSLELQFRIFPILAAFKRLSQPPSFIGTFFGDRIVAADHRIGDLPRLEQRGMDASRDLSRHRRFPIGLASNAVGRQRPLSGKRHGAIATETSRNGTSRFSHLEAVPLQGRRSRLERHAVNLVQRLLGRHLQGSQQSQCSDRHRHTK